MVVETLVFLSIVAIRFVLTDRCVDCRFFRHAELYGLLVGCVYLEPKECDSFRIGRNIMRYMESETSITIMAETW